MVVVKLDVNVKVSGCVAQILSDFVDVIPPEFPKNFPPRRAIDHKIELLSGSMPPAQPPYRMVRIAEGDESKTTCGTRYGSYEFLVIPFGLTNAPATFCNLMHDVLHEYLDDFVVVYLDDIIVYSQTLDKHMSYLIKVLSLLREYQLYVKMEV
uniref:RNA-directed DNA polymerase homolog n=1 Tax=Nicotiana tabacum TaxID=4097 RepID=A0A1S4A3C3_TOBAC|nr:PREDICTED: RNA-directed DNA polymerase homolog [Nicotiana tabacum]